VTSWQLRDPVIGKVVEDRDRGVASDCDFSFLVVVTSLLETLLNSQYGTINENGKRIVVPPVAITIARSMDDGFTPKDIVETLLNKVVAAIQDVFGNRTIGEDQRLSLSLFDLTRNPCEQCVSLFLNYKAKNCVAGGV
jgi:hypothetical protein